MADNEQKLKDKLTDWVTSYKDVAERNALAEEPDESAEYLVGLIKAMGYEQVWTKCPECNGEARGKPTLGEPDGSEGGCLTCNGTGQKRQNELLNYQGKCEHIWSVMVDGDWSCGLCGIPMSKMQKKLDSPELVDILHILILEARQDGYTKYSEIRKKSYHKIIALIEPLIEEAKKQENEDTRYRVLEYFRKYVREWERKQGQDDKRAWFASMWDMIHCAGKEDFSEKATDNREI